MRTSDLPRAQVVCRPLRLPGRAHKSSAARTDCRDARTGSQKCRTDARMSAQVAFQPHSAIGPTVLVVCLAHRFPDRPRESSDTAHELSAAPTGRLIDPGRSLTDCGSDLPGCVRNLIGCVRSLITRARSLSRAQLPSQTHSLTGHAHEFAGRAVEPAGRAHRLPGLLLGRGNCVIRSRKR